MKAASSCALKDCLGCMPMSVGLGEQTGLVVAILLTLHARRVRVEAAYLSPPPPHAARFIDEIGPTKETDR